MPRLDKIMLALLLLMAAGLSGCAGTYGDYYDDYEDEYEPGGGAIVIDEEVEYCPPDEGPSVVEYDIYPY